jgi:hypothetical protein
MLLAGVLLLTASAFSQTKASKKDGQWDHGGAAPACLPSVLGSPYIPVDSWVYPAVLRLYSLGFVDNVFLGMRPWTRASVGHMLEQAGAQIEDADAGAATDEAQDIYDALMRELRNDSQGPCMAHQGNTRIESVYSVARSISGTPLRDSYHLGSTIINDYGRPYASGFNNYSGASGYASAGRFVLYVRGETEAAPSATGYSQALAQALSEVDGTFFTSPSSHLTTYYLPQATIPMGPIASTFDGRFIEAFVSAHVLNHEISFGKQDNWLGPGLGGAMAYSNNAENIYSFRINRIEPLRIPLLSRLIGPVRYDFLVGGLRGHTYMPVPPNSSYWANVISPGNPWVHAEKFSFRPTENLEFGFERTIIWAGKGHEAVNLHNFLRGFFSTSAPNGPVKGGPNDPGARFSAFDFSYRLPLARKWLTLYTDSEVHDDISAADAPRRGSWRPGLYLSHLPGVPKLDIRVEGVYTDPPVSNSNGGTFMYWEGIQKQGYTNQGQLFGDWIGREDKGGQAWITYHLSGNEMLQVGVRHQKAAKDFIAGGTTLNDINFKVVKRIGKDFEVNGNFALEHWKAPVYLPGQQTVTTTTIQLTWFPERKVSF